MNPEHQEQRKLHQGTSKLDCIKSVIKKNLKSSQKRKKYTLQTEEQSYKLKYISHQKEYKPEDSGTSLNS